MGKSHNGKRSAITKFAERKEERPKKPFWMTAETVCDLVVCGECLNPRRVYSKRKLTKTEYTVCKEDYLYSCINKDDVSIQKSHTGNDASVAVLFHPINLGPLVLSLVPLA